MWTRIGRTKGIVDKNEEKYGDKTKWMVKKERK